METQPKTYTLGQLAEILGGELVGDPILVINAPATSKSENPNGLAFAESQAYFDQAEASGAGAIIVPKVIEKSAKSIIRHENPRAAFGKLLHLFRNSPEVAEGVHPTAIISDSAVLGRGVKIGAYAVIESGVQIGDGAEIFPFCYIGPKCQIGERTKVLPHAVLLQKVVTGTQCTIGPGAILGFDGFGYYWNGTEQVPIPQVGGVILGDQVDVGALTAIDRATADDTIIGDGTKLDNLVQIAHNARIGKNGVLASQVGIAGSATIGDRFVAGGQSGVSDHIVLVDGVSIGGRGAVLGNISEPGVYNGFPAMPISKFRRQVVVNQDLPDLLKRIRALEKRVNELEGDK